MNKEVNFTFWYIGFATSILDSEGTFLFTFYFCIFGETISCPDSYILFMSLSDNKIPTFN